MKITMTKIVLEAQLTQEESDELMAELGILATQPINPEDAIEKPVKKTSTSSDVPPAPKLKKKPGPKPRLKKTDVGKRVLCSTGEEVIRIPIGPDGILCPDKDKIVSLSECSSCPDKVGIAE